MCFGRFLFHGALEALLSVLWLVFIVERLRRCGEDRRAEAIPPDTSLASLLLPSCLCVPLVHSCSNPAFALSGFAVYFVFRPPPPHMNIVLDRSLTQRPFLPPCVYLCVCLGRGKGRGNLRIRCR